ncbi:MAG: hypothetical protein VKI81_11880 [Synechococcaceae cyanobacterium]|nr:hypothetical protein [Synechococcaceae cyanobacterium]
MAAVVLASGCARSDEPLPAGETTEKASATQPTREDVTRRLLVPLTPEEVWQLGRERFGWTRSRPPESLSREELIDFFAWTQATATAAATRNGATRQRLEPLTREEIWRLGVERFGWYGEEPPRDASKAELIRFYLVDERYEDWVDDDPSYIEDED